MFDLEPAAAQDLFADGWFFGGVAAVGSLRLPLNWPRQPVRCESAAVGKSPFDVAVVQPCGAMERLMRWNSRFPVVRLYVSVASPQGMIHAPN
ncbi:hypothetical protein ACH4S8_30975 [Streptomyces sp. NPDC021080]|uniref:hypothetical protein n=1 Tax=Streptomyces sp. NPDC021080 TaxID=3365110 RepID=UPI0037AD0FCA